VRRSGRSYADPLLVLVILERNRANSRFAVTAGVSIGNAIKRNRAKRLIRAALKDFLFCIKPGFDGLIIARKPLVNSSYGVTRQALQSLLNKAGLINSKTDG
jgi:ribonuclease P protein component